MLKPASTLLSRHHHEDRPSLIITPEMRLTLARTHEICGDARYTLALMIAARLQGPVLWIRPAWLTDQLNPCGMLHLVNPGRLIWAYCRREEDILWSMEEALRAGVVALVIAEMPTPPSLTPVRRLNLAAQTGSEFNHFAPLGLLLTPGDGGAAGVESRWHLAARDLSEQGGWCLSRRRARAEPPKSWEMHSEDGQLSLTPMTAQNTATAQGRERS